MLVTITSAGWLHPRENFCSKLEKATLYIKPKMPKLVSIRYRRTQEVSACSDMPFCLKNSAMAPMPTQHGQKNQGRGTFSSESLVSANRFKSRPHEYADTRNSPFPFISIL